MVVTNDVLLMPKSGGQAQKLSQRIVYLSTVVSVAGGFMQGAPQKDLSTGKEGKDNVKFMKKCRKKGPAQPISLILHSFLHIRQSYSVYSVSSVGGLLKGGTFPMEKSRQGSRFTWSSLKITRFCLHFVRARQAATIEISVQKCDFRNHTLKKR